MLRIFGCSLPGLAGPDLKGEALSPEHTGVGGVDNERSWPSAAPGVDCCGRPAPRGSRPETEGSGNRMNEWVIVGIVGDRRDLRRDEAPRDRPQPRPFVGRVQEGPEGRRRAEVDRRPRPTTPPAHARRDRPTRPRRSPAADRRRRARPSGDAYPRAILPRMPFTNAFDSSADRSDRGLDRLADRDRVGHVVAVAQLLDRHPQDRAVERRHARHRPPLARAPRAAGRSRARARRPRRPAPARTAAPRGRPRATTRGPARDRRP